MRNLLLQVIVSTALVPAAAPAAVVTRTYVVNAGPFPTVLNPPDGWASLSVTITFDPEAWLLNATPDAYTITPAYMGDGGLRFDYVPVNPDYLTLYNVSSGPGVTSDQNSFTAVLTHIRSTPTFDNWMYSKAGFGTVVQTLSGGVTVLPEPALAAILGAPMLARARPRRAIKTGSR